MTNIFLVPEGTTGSVPLTFQWPAATTPGAFVFHSADRPHLKWETRLGAPQVWKMTPSPSDSTPETIPGDPSQLDFAGAEKQRTQLANSGAGQPYLMAIKLQDEPRTLHLRSYLKNPGKDYAWADLKLVPQEIQALAAKTSPRSALAWSIFQSGGTPSNAKLDEALSHILTSENRTSAINALDMDTGQVITRYLQRPGHGLFFNPAKNHDAWLQPAPLSAQVAALRDEFLQTLEERFPAIPQGDTAAETFEFDSDQVEAFRGQIEHQSYEVPDSTATTKTRGSAQKAFADAVKANYGYRCAITGIVTKGFLVAAHIVPWSKDQSIRLDPSNGICLSLLVDFAFEKGHLLIEDDFTIRIDWEKVGDDQALRSQLEPYDGQKLRAPEKEAPQAKYLQRRRALVAATD